MRSRWFPYWAGLAGLFFSAAVQVLLPPYLQVLAFGLMFLAVGAYVVHCIRDIRRTRRQLEEVTMWLRQNGLLDD